MEKGMYCDPVTGACGPGEDEETGIIDFTAGKKVEFYYVTDPICSHCWAIEPILQKFRRLYGKHLKVQTVMGGLLEKWHDGPIDPANGIYEPADVAGHWREVGEQSRMPIDGSLMVDDPVRSSYPASRVFKVIQDAYGEKQASAYLRRAREELFAFDRNISDIEVLEQIVTNLGMDGKAISEEAESGKGQELLEEDFALTRRLGARGFPTIIMMNGEKQGVKIVGHRPLERYADGLKQVLGEDTVVPEKLPSLKQLLDEERLLFSKEVEGMYDLEPEEFPSYVQRELTEDEYVMEEILGERYIRKEEEGWL